MEHIWGFHEATAGWLNRTKSGSGVCCFSTCISSCLNACDLRCVYTAAWQTYLCTPQTEGQRVLGSSRPHSHSARSLRGHWSYAPDSESTEGPARKTCRNPDHMLCGRKQKKHWIKNTVWSVEVWRSAGYFLHKLMNAFPVQNVRKRSERS